jgi:hypothetical protein
MIGLQWGVYRSHVDPGDPKSLELICTRKTLKGAQRKADRIARTVTKKAFRQIYGWYSMGPNQMFANADGIRFELRRGTYTAR